MFKVGETAVKQPIGGLKYAVALRAIGQDLSGLMIESMEISVQDDVFVVKVRCIGSTKPVERKYRPEDVRILDEMAAAGKKGAVKDPDATNLAEALRTVGRTVDSKKGRLLKLVKDQRKLTFEYEDDKGDVRQEEFYGLSLYKGQQEGLALRGTQKKTDVWEDSR